jgi:beta-glucuronidase
MHQYCKKIQILFALIIFTGSINAQSISLNGNWTFSIDPLQKGEVAGWQLPWKIKEGDASLLVAGFDSVTVPHTFSIDTRYNIIGKVWYRKAFKLPSSTINKEIRLHFEAVFNKARIFINGTLVGLHEGGYTPFTIQVTKYIKPTEINFISVEVDNSWDEYSLPGARITDNSNAQVSPWYEYGGIIRDVYLLLTDKIYISNQKIESTPDLNTGNATIKIFTWIENKNNEDKNLTIKYAFNNRTTGTSINNINNQKDVFIKAYSKQLVTTSISLSKEDVLLWDYDNPNLYDIHTSLICEGTINNIYDAYFGIREVKVKGTQLLLNGKPIRIAGANRQSDHPIFGSTDPDTLAKQDMNLMRNGQMIFSRISHTPLSKSFYKWADEHGYLIIAEITNWQLSNVQMTSQRIKDAFAAQTKEFVESFWNSPSIVAYSTGNEYPSWTPEGDEWTRYQIDKFRALDTTRLMTFIAIGSATQSNNLAVAHNSFRYCDFLNFNNYSNSEGLIKNLETLHNKFPDKPIFLSETGLRSDQVKNESERILHLQNVIDVIKTHPYTIGFAYWTFNDYLSRYTSTNNNGYRPWGMVDASRNPKELYKAFQTKLSPVKVVIEKDKIRITGVADFPSYTLHNHVLKLIVGDKIFATYQLPIIEPGSSIDIKLTKVPSKFRTVIENKGGIVIHDSGL